MNHISLTELTKLYFHFNNKFSDKFIYEFFSLLLERSTRKVEKIKLI